MIHTYWNMSKNEEKGKLLKVFSLSKQSYTYSSMLLHAKMRRKYSLLFVVHCWNLNEGCHLRASIFILLLDKDEKCNIDLVLLRLVYHRFVRKTDISSLNFGHSYVIIFSVYSDRRLQRNLIVLFKRVNFSNN